MHNSQQLAALIKSLAKSKKISTGQMLLDCNLNKNSLSTMQSNGYLPRVETLVKIADYLGCSVDYLLGRIDEPKLETQADVYEHNSIAQVIGNNGEKITCRVDKTLSKELGEILDRIAPSHNISDDKGNKIILDETEYNILINILNAYRNSIK